MKLVKTIVNTNNQLIGFWIEGKESEFGGFGQIEVQRPVQLEEMIRSGFRNSQVAIQNGNIVELKDFRINSLPMSRFDGQGNFSEVDNRVMLVSRIIMDGKLAGFKVRLCGTDINFRYDDVIRLSNWFKPGNFIIRVVNRKMYIAGKPGTLQLEQLPEEVFGANVETSKKKRLGTGGATEENINSKGIYNDKDLLTLYSIVREFDGVILKLPSEEYIRTLKYDKKVAGEFRDLGVGEIGDPYIKFGEKKLNANTNFKKVGNVMVPVTGGMPFPVYTYTHTTKSIFVNGEHHIKRFGIAVKQEGVDKILAEYKDSLVVKPITDKDVTGPISQLTGKPDLAFFEVDTSKLSIISPDRAEKYILPNKEVKAVVEQLMRAKTHNKYCNGALKDINDMARASKIYLVPDDKKPFGLYAGLTPQYLKAVHEAGINIFTGAYIKLQDVNKEEDSEDDIEGAPAVEIEYGVNGTDIARLTYKAMCDPTMRSVKSHPMVDAQLIKLIDEVNSIKDIKERFKAVLKYQEGLEKCIYDCRRKLWMHKMGMFYAGNGKIHTHDRTVWIDKGSRSSNMTVYDCVEYGCDGLFLMVKGTTL